MASTVLDKVDAMDAASAGPAVGLGHSHRSGGTAVIKQGHLEKGRSRAAKLDPADVVLRALEDGDEPPSPPSSPTASPAARDGPPPPKRRTAAQLARGDSDEKPTTVSLDDILGSPSPESAGGGFGGGRGARLADSAGARADDLERAIFDTMSSHGGNGEGVSWPVGAQLRMPVTVVNRWGRCAAAEIEVEVGRMRYSRKVFKPADMLDLVYDDVDERVLTLHLAGRSRGKRVLCENGERRNTLAGWLAAWKLGVHPELSLIHI